MLSNRVSEIMTTHTHRPTSSDDARFREECRQSWRTEQEPVGRQLRLLLGIVGTAHAIAERITERLVASDQVSSQRSTDQAQASWYSRCGGQVSGL